jgi:hypothetical protein
MRRLTCYRCGITYEGQINLSFYWEKRANSWFRPCKKCQNEKDQAVRDAKAAKNKPRTIKRRRKKQKAKPWDPGPYNPYKLPNME